MLDITPVSNLTLDCNQPTIDLTAIASGGSGQWIYNWSGANISSADPTINVHQSGYYLIQLQDEITGCEASLGTDIFSDIDYPIGNIINPFGMLGCSINEMELTASFAPTNDDLDISWTGPAGAITSNDPTNIMATLSGWYFLNIDNPDNGCSTIDSVEVWKIQMCLPK